MGTGRLWSATGFGPAGSRGAASRRPDAPAALRATRSGHAAWVPAPAACPAARAFGVSRALTPNLHPRPARCRLEDVHPWGLHASPSTWNFQSVAEASRPEQPLGRLPRSLTRRPCRPHLRKARRKPCKRARSRQAGWRHSRHRVPSGNLGDRLNVVDTPADNDVDQEEWKRHAQDSRCAGGSPSYLSRCFRSSPNVHAALIPRRTSWVAIPMGTQSGPGIHTTPNSFFQFLKS